MTTRITAEAERLSKKKHVTISEALDVAGDFGRFKRALASVPGLAALLNGPGPFTVFAPGDAAFKPHYDALMLDRKDLVAVLRNHIVAGAYSLEQLRDMPSLITLDGRALEVQHQKTPLLHVEIDGIRITQGNIRCSNGFVHEIGGVLML